VSWTPSINKEAIYVDEGAATMEICGKRILGASSSEGTLNLTWYNKGWEQWEELQKDQVSSRSFKGLILP
jgi:hypothetical protein